jgi:hypothetical protein
MTKPTDKEIEDVIERCLELESDCDTNYEDMTFEQGVKYAIEWMQGTGPHPLDD